jgi:hypothetical protein
MANLSQDGSRVSGSFADEEAALKRGQSGLFGALAVIVALVAVGMWLLVGQGDDERVYGELGKQINGLKQAHFDQFLGCALSGANLKDVKTNTDLAAQLSGRARERGRAYGLYLRDACAGQLTEIEPRLDTLIMPEDLKDDVAKLKAATSKLRSGTGAFISYLDHPEFKYDEAASAPYIETMTRGWFEFRQAHADLNKTLRSRLEP